MNGHKKTILITRTQPDADVLAARVEALGYKTLIEPMLAVRPTGLPTPYDLMCTEGLVVTSAHALRHLNAFVRNAMMRHKPLYAVGPRTAALALELGWTHVHDGGGDVRALGDFLHTRKEVTPYSRLMHICGRDIARDTRGILDGLKAQVWDWIVYETDTVPTPSTAFDNAMRTNDIDATLVYSARAAAALAARVRTYEDKTPAKQMFVLCLSPSVLQSFSDIQCAGAYAAEKPDEESLLTLLQDVCPA